LFGAIIFVPQEEFGEAIFTCFLFLLLILSELPLLRSKSAREVKEREERSTTYWAFFILFWVSVGLMLVYAIFYLIILYLEGLWN